MFDSTQKRSRPRSALPSIYSGTLTRIDFDSDKIDDGLSNTLFQNTWASSFVSDIQSALTTEQRISILKRLESELLVCTPNNHDTGSHCKTYIQAGVVSALFFQLNMILHRHGSTLHEFKLIFHSLDLLLQSSVPEQPLFCSILSQHGEEIIGMLAEVLELCFISDECDSTCDLPSQIPCLQKYIFSIAHTISASSAGSIIVFKNQTFLLHIVAVLSNVKSYRDTVQEALGVMKNLTYYEEDGRQDILHIEGFLLSLTSLPRRFSMHSIEGNNPPVSSKSISSSSREASKSPLARISAVFRNLATCSACRSTLIRTPAFLNSMVDLCNLGEYRIYPSNKQQTVLRNVLNMLVSLALDSQDSTLMLLLHDDGVLIRILKRFLNRTPSSEKQNSRDATNCNMLDHVVRKRAARVLRLLINEATAPLLLRDSGLITAIASAAQFDSSIEVRSEAAETFARCAGMVASQSISATSKRPPQHNEAVLNAMTSLFDAASRENLSGQNSFPPCALARALKDHAIHPANRVSMAERRDLLKKAARVALLTEDISDESAINVGAVEDTCCAFMYISMEKRSRALLCSVPRVLTALVANATLNANNPGLQTTGFIRQTNVNPTKKYSLQALLNLASDERNLHTLAHHPGLVQCFLEHVRTMPLTGVLELENYHPNNGQQSQTREKFKDTIVMLAKQL